MPREEEEEEDAEEEAEEESRLVSVQGERYFFFYLRQEIECLVGRDGGTLGKWGR